MANLAYLGCWANTADPATWALPVELRDDPAMTIEMCRTEAQNAQLMIFGLQGTKCYGGGWLGRGEGGSWCLRSALEVGGWEGSWGGVGY